MAHTTYATPVYASTGDMSVRTYVETYTFFELLGDVTGKAVLDVACGHGFYSRLLKERGAARVVGLDLSESLVGLARAIERENPLGIEYHVLDVFEAPVLGAFDRITAAWLLPYSTSPAQLEAMGRKLHAQLAPGGRIVGIVPHPSPDSRANYTKYGMTIAAPEAPVDGDEYDIAFHVEPPFAIRSRIWTQPTIARALTAAGLRDVQWSTPRCSPEGLARFEAGYWDHMLTRPNMLFFTCSK